MNSSKGLSMAVFASLLYTLNNATPHFGDVCSIFVQTTVYLLSFLLHNLTQTFNNVYNLHFVSVHNVYIAR